MKQFFKALCDIYIAKVIFKTLSIYEDTPGFVNPPFCLIVVRFTPSLNFWFSDIYKIIFRYSNYV